MTESEEQVTHEVARDESVCGVFCDSDPDVSFEAFGYTFHRCRDCYECDCNRCHEQIPEDTRGSTRAKGWCEDCRQEVRLICGDDERGIQKDPDKEQATLVTDGGHPDGEDSQKQCTDKVCVGSAQYALWMGEHFSRVSDAHPSFSYDDGDLHPHVCEECLPRYRDLHGDKGEFVRPEEKLVTNGGQR